MTPERAHEIVSDFHKQILVIGDVMLDRFVWGTVNRFSPEAPSCPILDVTHEKAMLGGAGNAATNLGALGAKCVRLVGLIGFDEQGRDIEMMFRQPGQKSPVDNNLVKVPSRPTTSKTRFVSTADDVHLLRLDQETIEPLSQREFDRLSHSIRQWSSLVSGILVEDYGKGVVTPEILRLVSSVGAERNIPVFVDPKKDHWEHFRNTEVVTPNEGEAYAALGLQVGSCPIEDVGEKLLKYTRSKTVIITRGSAGMTAFEQNGECSKVTAPAVEAVDVSGAGDTAVAMLTLSRLAGASWIEAMELANAAASIVVAKRGTSTVSAEELLSLYGE